MVLYHPCSRKLCLADRGAPEVPQRAKRGNHVQDVYLRTAAAPAVQFQNTVQHCRACLYLDCTSSTWQYILSKDHRSDRRTTCQNSLESLEFGPCGRPPPPRPAIVDAPPPQPSAPPRRCVLRCLAAACHGRLACRDGRERDIGGGGEGSSATPSHVPSHSACRGHRHHGVGGGRRRGGRALGGKRSGGHAAATAATRAATAAATAAASAWRTRRAPPSIAHCPVAGWQALPSGRAAARKRLAAGAMTPGRCRVAAAAAAAPFNRVAELVDGACVGPPPFAPPPAAAALA